MKDKAQYKALSKTDKLRLRRVQRAYREAVGNEMLKSSDFVFDKRVDELTNNESLLLYSLRKEMRSN